MTPLKLRKQALTLESDLNRLALRAGFQGLRDTRTWAGSMKRGRGAIARWGLVLAPLFAVVTAVGLRRTSRLFGLAVRVLGAVRDAIGNGRPNAVRF
jgi:hypothetical protein